MYDAMMAETVKLRGHGGDEIEGYLARPLDAGPHGGVVVIHHMPGYDAATKEIVRKFAANGYAALCPNLHYREAPGASPDDAAAASRAAGGVPDERLVGDVQGAMSTLQALSSANGKVGAIGYCSGGRQAYLAACSLPLDAAVDCYGGFVVGDPPADFPIPVRPIIDKAPDLACPLLGLFGNDDEHPSPDDVAVLESELAKHGKTFEKVCYDDAGHAFFAVDRPSYRPHAANDGWQRVFEWFGRYLSA